MYRQLLHQGWLQETFHATTEFVPGFVFIHIVQINRSEHNGIRLVISSRMQWMAGQVNEGIIESIAVHVLKVVDKIE